MRTIDHHDIIQRYGSMLAGAAGECRDRPEVRAELDADPRAFFVARGVDVPEGMEVRVADDTADTVHLVMPPNPNNAIADDALTGIAGGSATIAVWPASSVVSTVSSMQQGPDA